MLQQNLIILTLTSHSPHICWGSPGTVRKASCSPQSLRWCPLSVLLSAIHIAASRPYSPGHSKQLNRIRFQLLTEVAPARLSSLSSCHLWLHTLSPIQPRVKPIIQRCCAFSPLHNSAGAVPNTQSTLLCLHLTNFYTSFGPQLNSHLLQEALSNFQARLKASSVSPLLQCRSLHTVYLLAFPISGCGFNEGKDCTCFSPVLSPAPVTALATL